MTYAVIRCNVKHMYSISRFLIDFTTEFVQNEKSDIQLSELTVPHDLHPIAYRRRMY